MRFKTKFDWWIVAALGVAPTLFGYSLTRVVLGHGRQEMLWVMSGVMLVWLGAMSACWPQYYEIRDDGLFVRQGWRRIFAPYDSLTSVTTTTSALSAAVFSTDRVAVTTSDGRLLLIAPANQMDFLDEIAARAPQFERRAGGLQVPFSGLSAI